MPELPEVETVRTGLSEFLPGKRITGVDFNWQKSFPNAAADIQAFLIGAAVTTVRRRAKVLLIDLDSGYSLIVHLKMTGQLVYRGDHGRFGAGHPSHSLVGELPDRSTRVTVQFSDQSRLFFNDQRKFGWMRLMPTTEIDNLDFFRKVGPEPLSKDFTAAGFITRVRHRPNRGIKAVLLDQTVIAGIGNIYADESLWTAKLHPEAKVATISDAQLERLYTAIRDVLQLSIAKGGLTDRNYVDARGRGGSYLSFAQVFRREGQPCPRCGASVIKVRVAGRGTHICPVCQQR